MNRETLLIYLRDIRDLEMVRASIENVLKKEKVNYNTKTHNLRTPKYVKVPDRINLKQWLIELILFILGALLLTFIGVVICDMLGFGDYLWRKIQFGLFARVYKPIKFYIACFSLVGFTVLVYKVFLKQIFNLIKKNKLNKMSIFDSQKLNDGEILRVKNNVSVCMELEEKWKENKCLLNSELQNASSLLMAFYDLNILPNPYRSLAAVFYIYDYMSSSQATLEDTLIHEHIENGIQQIMEKLNVIIEQDSKLIIKNRIREAKDYKINEKNIEILQSSGMMESDILDLYKELLENYNRANAYFNESTLMSRTPM